MGKKPKPEGRAVTDDPYPYEWRWLKKLPERKGEACRIVNHATMNSVLVEFESDGYEVVTSRWAIRRRRHAP